MLPLQAPVNIELLLIVGIIAVQLVLALVLIVRDRSDGGRQPRDDAQG